MFLWFAPTVSSRNSARFSQTGLLLVSAVQPTITNGPVWVRNSIGWLPELGLDLTLRTNGSVFG